MNGFEGTSAERIFQNIEMPSNEELQKLLQEKYDISNIKANSEEYLNLINDLFGMGFISTIPMNLVRVNNIEASIYSARIALREKETAAGLYDDMSLIEWYKKYLELYAVEYAALLEKKNLNDDRELRLLYLNSQKDVFDVLKEIFAREDERKQI